jgi:hypothetical protein
MATFLTKREAKERAKTEREQKRREKLYFSDLLWSAKRRWLTDSEWYDLHKLNEVYGNWGPERSEYEFGLLADLREYFKRHQVGSKCPHMNALEKHLAMHAEKQKTEEVKAAKPIVHAHPTLKKTRKSKVTTNA